VKQIWSIAATTLGEAIRRRVLLIILLIGVLFLTIAPSLGSLSARSETTVLRGMMLGIIQLTSAAIAVVLTVYMIPNEIERRTIYTILSKPVQRWQFLLGKYFGAVLALGLMMALMTAVLILAFFMQKGVDFQAGADLATGPMMFFIQMSVLAAVAIFFSTFVSPLVNFFLSGGVFLLGSLFNPFFQTLEETRKTQDLLYYLLKGVNTFLPNFAYYNIQNPIINPSQVIQNPTAYYLQITGYGLLYIGIVLVGGILVFDRREV
jgi:ABC-type transport system involved in multi-copper enzyme maturation permease subunit